MYKWYQSIHKRTKSTKIIQWEDKRYIKNRTESKVKAINSLAIAAMANTFNTIDFTVSEIKPNGYENEQTTLA